MGFKFFSNNSSQAQAYNEYQNSGIQSHKAGFGHELLAGAASYEAAKAFEKHVAQNGPPESHSKAKEIMAGLAGAFIDKEVESKGLNEIDAERAKRQAREQIDSVDPSQLG